MTITATLNVLKNCNVITEQNIKTDTDSELLIVKDAILKRLKELHETSYETELCENDNINFVGNSIVLFLPLIQWPQ